MNTRYALRLLAGFLRSLIVIAVALLALLGLVCALIVAQGRRDEAQQVGAGQVRQIILTGGVGAGDSVSEAAAGKQYLIDRGMTADALLLEEQGMNTWES